MINENNVTEIMKLIMEADRVGAKYKDYPKTMETVVLAFRDMKHYAKKIKDGYPAEDVDEAAKRFEEMENRLLC